VAELVTVLTCPSCASEQRATIPTDACQFFFSCAACGQRLRPKPGDCCVFCSYATDT
jgi:transcription elongation factor Elf1